MLGKFKQDIDGRYYFVPEKSIDEFESLVANIGLTEYYGEDFNSANKVFNQKFGKYRLVYPITDYLVDCDFHLTS